MTKRALLLLSFVLLVGCPPTEEPPADAPLPGSDTELYCEWDVNEHVPSESVCAAAGIDEVVVVFFRSGETAPEFTSNTFRFPCADGYYDSGTARVIAAGSWDYQWRAMSDDVVVRQSIRYPMTAVEGTEFVLQAVNFERLLPIEPTVTLRWGTDVGFGTCTEAFAETMSWELRKGTSTGALEASDPGSPCAGTIAIPNIPVGSITEGTHVLIVSGAAMDGAAWSAECTIVLPEGGEATVSCDVPRVP